MKQQITSIILFLMAILAMNNMKAQTFTMNADDVIGELGSTVELTITMTNDVPARDMQMCISLPAGVEVAKNASGKYTLRVGDKNPYHGCAINLDGGIYRIAVSSSNADIMSTGSGSILVVPLVLNGEIGSSHYELSEIHISYMDNNNKSIDVSLPDMTGEISITNPVSKPYGDNQLYILDTETNTNQNTVVTLGYNSDSEVYEYSAVITFPEGVNVNSVSFCDAVNISNFSNEYVWDENASTLTISGVSARRGPYAVKGDNMIAQIEIAATGLAAGAYQMTITSQSLSNETDDFSSTAYHSTLTVRGAAPTSVVLIDGESYSNANEYQSIDVKYTRTFAANVWQPLYVPFNMSYDEWADYGRVAELSCVHAYEDGRTTIEFVSVNNGELLPNVPYVFLPHSGGEITFDCSDKTLKPAPVEGTKYIMCSSPRYIFKIYGNYQPIIGSTLATYGDPQFNGAYVLTTGSKFQHCSASSTLKPYRFYITREKSENGYWAAPSTQNVPSATDEDDVIYFMVDGVVCGMATVVTEESENGVMTFDIMGRKIENPTSGVYIQNGKKILIN